VRPKSGKKYIVITRRLKFMIVILKENELIKTSYDEIVSDENAVYQNGFVIAGFNIEGFRACDSDKPCYILAYSTSQDQEDNVDCMNIIKMLEKKYSNKFKYIRSLEV